MVHIQCPFAPVWDYYKVVIRTSFFIQVETLERMCDQYRGHKIEQEVLAGRMVTWLREVMPTIEGELILSGRHGANCKVTVKLPLAKPEAKADVNT